MDLYGCVWYINVYVIVFIWADVSQCVGGSQRKTFWSVSWAFHFV